MSTSYRCLSLLFGIVAAALAILAIAQRSSVVRLTPPEEEGVTVEAASQSFGAARAGAEVTVRFLIRNRSNRTVKLLGSSGSCSPAGCISADGFPVEMPPWSEHSVEVQCQGRTGHYRQEISVYTSYPGQAELPLTVEGDVHD